MDLLIPVITMTVLGFLFSTGLALAYKKLRVEEDPKVAQVIEVLPQANCGACGYSGCRVFAEAIAQGAAAPNSCPVGGEEVAHQIAAIMGVEAGKIVKKTARLHCRGTLDAAKANGIYVGISTCYASHLIGGSKQCSYGCLGSGDCVQACQFDALSMGKEGLPLVIEENCTACGKCVDTCPRNLFEPHPLTQDIMVFCRSEDGPKASRTVCKNACIACGICVRACPEAIILDNNLVKITDYKMIDAEKIPEIEKCPTNAIGRLNKENEG